MKTQEELKSLLENPKIEKSVPDELDQKLAELACIEQEKPSPEATAARQALEIEIYGTTSEEVSEAMLEMALLETGLI